MYVGGQRTIVGVVPQVLFTLLLTFELEPLTGLELIMLTRLGAQESPGDPPVSIFQCRDL